MNIYFVTWTISEYENDGRFGGKGRFVDRSYNAFITCRDEYYAEKAMSAAYSKAENIQCTYIGEA